MYEVQDRQNKEKERSRFFSNVSHELKTPLSVSQGYIEFLMDGVRKDKTEEYLQILKKENKRMSEIVMNMLELIEFEEKEEINLTKQPVLPLIHEAKRHFEVILHEKDTNININGDFTKCYFEEKSLITVLLNLISNGIKYGVKGETIEISGVVDKDIQQICIKNKALNYDEIDMDAVFQRFYATDKSRNSKTSGTGLGMSLVKTILENYNVRYSARLKDEYFIFELYLKTNVSQIQ